MITHTLTLHPLAIDTSATDHDVVDYCETTFAAHPLPGAIFDMAVSKSGSFV